MTSLSPISVQGHMSDLDGHIECIFGPMFSGKSTELMRRIRRYTHAKKVCHVIKYAADTRYDNECASTHDLQKCDARAATKLSDLAPESFEEVDVIGIDEGQFFVDIVEFSDMWASRGKVVIVAALDATFERKPFGRILELIPLAESILKLTAVCMLCHREASFTKRIGSEKTVEVIGGADLYLSTCRTCFLKPADTPVVTPTNENAAILRTASTSPVLTFTPSTAMVSSKSTGIAMEVEVLPTLSNSLANNKRITTLAPLRPIDTNAPADDQQQLGKKRKAVGAATSADADPTTKKQHLEDKENAPPLTAVC